MGTLIYWIRKLESVREKGWRYIQYSALFFILWNIDAFAVHLLDEQIHAVVVSREASFQIKISTMEGLEWIRLFYYLAKLDHLLCVPAMFFLYLALRSLLCELPRLIRGACRERVSFITYRSGGHGRLFSDDRLIGHVRSSVSQTQET